MKSKNKIKLGDLLKLNNKDAWKKPASLFSDLYCQLRTTVNNGIIWNIDKMTGKTSTKSILMTLEQLPGQLFLT